jgi:peptidoglycan hydrolase-like protein with peptidoglycan-binding domain
MPVLSQGMRGPEVELAQAALNFHATPGDPMLVIDGSFGNQTKARTISFQRAANLKQDGVIGPMTQAKLFATVQVSAKVHFSKKSRIINQQRNIAPVGTMSSFPQLTLPPIVPPRPAPQLIPPLTLSVPLVQGETTWAPPQIFRNQTKPTVQIFPINVTILQPLWHAPLVPEDTSSVEAHEFWAKVFYQQEPVQGDVTKATFAPYIKAVSAGHPTIPDEEVFKVGGGIMIRTDLGGFHLKLKGGASILKFDPTTGQLKAGVHTIDGSIQLGH